MHSNKNTQSLGNNFTENNTQAKNSTGTEGTAQVQRNVAKKRSKTQKPVPFRELGMLNRFFFDAVAEDDETCRAICEIILGRNLPPFTHTQAEKEFRKSPVFRSIRMDIFSKCEASNTINKETESDRINSVYAENDVPEKDMHKQEHGSDGENEEVFNTELQGRNTGNLPRRSRYYQAHLDVSLLEPGEIDFNRLSNSFLIFICPFDLFGEKRYCYTFRMRADENTDLLLQDGMTRIFLNTQGTNDDEVSPELVEFLHYIEISDGPDPPKTDSMRIQKIYDRVKKVRESEKLEVEYMQAWEELAYARQDGRNEGITDGLKAVISRMLTRKLPDSDILELSGCKQELIDEVRRETSAAIQAPTSI